jgi:hypothetical protein
MAVALLNHVRAHVAIEDVESWVIEDQQDYVGKDGRKVSLNHLRAVVKVVERHLSRRVTKKNPHRWKGNVPKDIHWARIGLALSPAERVIFHRLKKDGRDAVALGMWATGRVGRGGVSRGK